MLKNLPWNNLKNKRKKMTREIKSQHNYKHGKVISYYADDQQIGTALELYGEYSDYEVELFVRCLKEGDVALEVGSNIGALTVPMANFVGTTGHVYAIEPGEDCVKLLKINLKQNGLKDRVTVFQCAASNFMHENATISYNPDRNYPKVNLPGDGIYNSGIDAYTNTITIDSLNLEKLKFAKIDVDGCEQQVIEGMRETIARCKPIVYIENEVPLKAEKLTATLVDLGYRGFWYKPPLFREDNHLANSNNVFGAIISKMQIWIPWQSGIVIEGCDEVADLRNDDDIFNREAARFGMYSEQFLDDVDVRLAAAHYENLMQRTEKAAELINENLRRHPGNIPSLRMRGLHQLQAGNYKDGWQGYELRYDENKYLKQFGGHRKPRGVTTWNGEETENLLIWNEQGFGDSIMFARFIRFARQRAKNVILEIQTSLFELFEQSGLVDRGNLVRLGRPLPDLEGPHCSLPSLPAALGDDGRMIPSGPYLFANDHLVEQWKEIVGLHRKIGLCFKGSSRSERPYSRDIPIHLLRNLQRDHGEFFSLVPEEGVLAFDNFASTAAAVMALDVIVTVDTSIAHLAGALGKETFLLLAFDPDWRWGLKGSTTIWYPNMHILRQPKVRDWESVVKELDVALTQRFSLKQAAE
jgi:FkbM family methyltransferase